VKSRTGTLGKCWSGEWGSSSAWGWGGGGGRQDQWCVHPC
jgi:hypothetical protein